MCQYYAHAFLCKHTSYTFARFCRDASMIQTPCAGRDVWQTIRMEEACDECKAWFDTAAAATTTTTNMQRTRHAVRRTRS